MSDTTTVDLLDLSYREGHIDGYRKGYARGYAKGKRDAPPSWIPLSERLPECGRNILAWVLDGRDGHMTVARFDDGKAYWSYMNRNYYPKGEIVAWMPLPEPYAERRTE